MMNSKRHVFISLAFLALLPTWGQQTTKKLDLAQDTIRLNEVVIRNTRPISQLKDDGIVTEVRGSILEKLGTARDVLGFLPGVVSYNGSIEVFGKGAPVIYINGRRLRDGSELDQLESDKIKNVKVISNPGARYGASTNAVIRIYTDRKAGEGFSLDTRTILGYLDYLYGKETVNASYRTGGLEIFGLLEYDKSKKKGTSWNRQVAWSRHCYEEDIAQRQERHSQVYQGQLGFDYMTKNNQSFGLYYKHTRTPATIGTRLNTAVFVDSVADVTVVSDYDRSEKYHEHLIDGYYSGNIRGWSLDATFDMLWRNTDNGRAGIETAGSGSVRDIVTYESTSGRMIAGEAHLSRAFLKGTAGFGVELTDSRRSADVRNAEAILGSSNNEIKETTTAFYAEVLQRLGKASVRVGLRYEYVDSRYYEAGVKSADQSRTYGKFFPSFLFSVPFKSSALQISYTRKFKRPAYSQLSSAITYDNRYLYESGNPFLRPSCIDNLSLTFKYKWLLAVVNLNHISDGIISKSEPYAEDESVTLMKKINSPFDCNEWQIMVQAQPSFFGNRYFPILAFGILGQFYKSYFRSEVKRFNRPMPMVQFRNIIRLPNDYMVTASLLWKGKGNSDNILMGQTWQASVTGSKVFSKNWEVRMSLSDIFNTSGKTHFDIYSDSSLFSTERGVNGRSIECTVRYKFNIAKSKYKGKGAGNSERNRL